MKKVFLFSWIIQLLLFSCKKEDVDKVEPLPENCVQFTDPKGVKRTFYIYDKELSNNTVLGTNGGVVPNGTLKLYFSENPNSIIGLTLTTDIPYDFRRNFTLSGSWETLPGGNSRFNYNKVFVVFWDGNPQGYGMMAERSDLNVSEYSYSQDVYDQHILKGKMTNLYFEKRDSTELIPSFGVSKAEITDFSINIKY